MNPTDRNPPHLEQVRARAAFTAARTIVRVHDGMDAAQLLRTLRDGRRLILGIAGWFFAAVALFTLASHMQFGSRGRLYLGELEAKDPSSARSANDLELSNGDQSDLGSESQILQSDSLISRAILESGLNVRVSPIGWHAPRYLEWLLAHRDPDLVEVGTSQLGAVNTTLDDNYRGLRSYRAVFTSSVSYELWTYPSLREELLAIPQRWLGLPCEEVRKIGTGLLGEPLDVGNLHMTLLPGTERGPTAGTSYRLKVTPLDDMVVEVSKALTVTFPKPIAADETTKIITLEFDDASPHLAAAFLRNLMRGYLEEHQSWKTEDATAAEAFVSSQLGVIREALDTAGKKMAEYRSKSKVVVLDNEASAMIEQIGKYEEQRIAARLQVASLSDLQRALKKPNAKVEAFLLGEGTDTVLTELASSLSKARQELAALEEKYNPAAPDVRHQRAQVETQLDMIRNYVANRLNRAQESLSALSGVVGQYEAKLKTVPGAELGLAQLARESEVYSKVYSYLLERQQQTAILKASRVSKNRVLDAPVEAYAASSPKLLLRFAVSLFGLFFGCAFVLIRRALSPAVQSETDLQQRTGPLPIFANVPRRPKLATSASAASMSPLDAVLGHSDSAFAESFRMLRTNLYFCRNGDGGQVVLITSPARGDGKTTTAFALAAMLAADHKTVLVIDADLRNPAHHALLCEVQEPGLSAILAGECDWADAIRCPMPFVHAITAGAAASSDLLSGDELSHLLQQARANFDFVLIDAPSFPSTSDALVLCAHADCLLSVLRVQSTPRRLAVEHIDRLGALVPSYGVIVNDAGPVPRSRAPRTPPAAWKATAPSAAAVEPGEAVARLDGRF